MKKSILITSFSKEDIKEAKSLADAAGYSVEKIINQRHLAKSKYGIGIGKAEEVREIIEQMKTDVIIFDSVLKPSQQYNLTSICKIEVIDRERLILEIFERRASSTESRIQIKLAQLQYDMVRVKEKVRLSKAGEQPGFFGMGKYDADVYYLDIKKRASTLKRKLQKEETRRNLYRIQRRRAGLKTISLSGYTSAGKTTLFNTLTAESKAIGQGMFTTLSTSTRAINLVAGRVLVSDTVGFISKLPAYMIDAFKSTLHELTYSCLIILVIDVSDPLEEIRKKLDSSIRILNELKVPLTRVIYVLNKIDLVSADDAIDKSSQLDLVDQSQLKLQVSAKTGYNINQLKFLVAQLIFTDNEENAVHSHINSSGDDNSIY
ncbi:MAG TPA: GTPase HflX [Nitrososphaeraceae archaeon]|nr:GTPase HflX [Nitrososphaeraceae archaeon]